MSLNTKKNTLQENGLSLFPRLSQSQSHSEGNQERNKTLEESIISMQGNPSLIQPKGVKKRKNKKQRSGFWPQELKKIIQSNKLTINISEKTNKQENEWLRKQNFGHLQGQLVRQSVFEYYKELNQKIGDTEEHILKQYRHQQQNQMKFRLDPEFKIKIRTNIYQKQAKQNKRSQSTSLPSHIPYQIINNVLINSQMKNAKARFIEKFFWRKEKWKLTDFFNSIVSQQEKVNELVEHRKTKIELATKLTKLDKKCQQLQQNENQRYLLDTFQKFNEKVNDKLCKKQKRLSKIKFIMRNGLQ